jgi:hypothetical protein
VIRRSRKPTVAPKPRTLTGAAGLPRDQWAGERIKADLGPILDQLGYIWWSSPDSRRELGGGGITDIVAAHPRTGTLLFWECKGEHGRLSKTRIRINRRGRATRIRGQVEWQAALTKSMLASNGVVDYRIVKPSTYKLAVNFLLGEHARE